MRAISNHGLAIFLVFMGSAAFAAEPGVQGAIRAEVEQLRETGRLSAGGIEVASGKLLARIYENRNFEPAWPAVERMDELIRLVEALRGEPTLWRNEVPTPPVQALGEPAWVSQEPLTASDISELYLLEWEGEAGAPDSCPLLAFANLGDVQIDGVVRRADSSGEMLLAWDRTFGPGHNGFSQPCQDCGRGVVGLGTFQFSQIFDREITHEWSDGSKAAAFEGFYGTELHLQPTGFDCIYWMWSHLGREHVDYLLTQLRRVEGYPPPLE